MEPYDDLSKETRERTIALIQKRIDSRPGSPWSRLWAAEILLLQQNTDAAVAELANLTASSDRELAGAAFANLGEIFEATDRLQEALQAYRNADERQMSPVLVVARIAGILKRQGQREQASLAFERALRLIDEKTLAALQGIARDYSQLLVEMSQTRLATELIERLMARYPERTELIPLLETLGHPS